MIDKENKKIILSEKHAAKGEEGKPELAIDDKAAIAEFEKEVFTTKPVDGKKKYKAKPSHVGDDKAETTEVLVETPEEVPETAEETKAEASEQAVEAADEATSDEAESTKDEAEAKAAAKSADSKKKDSEETD